MNLDPFMRVDVSNEEGVIRYMKQGLIDMYTHAGDIGLAVEVGCWTGESAIIASEFVDILYCVDSWAGEFAHLESLFDERTKGIYHIRKLKLPSHEAVDHFEDGELDLVYIDAMHDYDNVKRDLLTWIPKVKINSWIAGHDYDKISYHAGVVQAVNEILGVPELTFKDGSFLVRRTQ
jgi:hypothetical protein